MYSYDIIYIKTSCPTSSTNIFSVFVVVALSSILSALQYQGVLVGLIYKIILARMPVAY
jgi:hypothetical protein